VQTLAATLHLRIDQFVLSYVRSPTEVGYYGVGVTIVGLLLKISEATGTVVFPRLAASDRKEAQLATARVVRHTLFLTGLGVIGLGIAGPIAIRVLYGTRFEPAIIPMLILLPGALMMSLYQLLTRTSPAMRSRRSTSSRDRRAHPERRAELPARPALRRGGGGDVERHLVRDGGADPARRVRARVRPQRPRDALDPTERRRRPGARGAPDRRPHAGPAGTIVGRSRRAGAWSPGAARIVRDCSTARGRSDSAVAHESMRPWMLAASPLVRQSGFVSSDAHLLVNLAIALSRHTCTAATPPLTAFASHFDSASASFCAVVSFAALHVLFGSVVDVVVEGAAVVVGVLVVVGAQATTGVAFCVLALTPDVLDTESCTTPFVYWAVAVTNPPVTSAGLAVYEISPLWTDVVAARQPSAESVPPMHGTGLLMTCGTPSGVVSENEPPANAHMFGVFCAFWSVAR
jgi:hypothetical protein